MRKMTTSIPLFILLSGTVIPIVDMLVFSMNLQDYSHIFNGLSCGLSFALVNWIEEKKSKVSVRTGVIMISFGLLFFIGCLLLVSPD